MINNYRFELSFKTLDQLKKKIEFCVTKNIKSINIPCKGVIKKEFLIAVIEFIGKNYSQLDVIYHYSLFHQFSRTNEKSYEEFLCFIQECKKYKNKEILLISGTKKRKNFEVIDVLHKIRDINNFKLNLGVAYNPYYSNRDDIDKERKNLIEKINSGLIYSIWLQFGSDVNLLNNQINFLNKIICRSPNRSKNKIKIYGSLFIPSKQFLARFRFRPWRGVFLDDKYLNSLEYSEQITKNIMNIYLKNNIIPLIETDCSSIKQYKNLLEFDKNNF